MISKEEFLAKAKGCSHTVPSSRQEGLPVNALVRREHIGGYAGGNCWGGEAQYSAIEVSDPGIGPVLDPVLDEMFPELSRLQYRKVLALTQEFMYSVEEYYGNTRKYKVWSIDLDLAWDLLSPEPS